MHLRNTKQMLLQPGGLGAWLGVTYNMFASFGNLEAECLLRHIHEQLLCHIFHATPSSVWQHEQVCCQTGSSCEIFSSEKFSFCPKPHLSSTQQTYDRKHLWWCR